MSHIRGRAGAGRRGGGGAGSRVEQSSIRRAHPGALRQCLPGLAVWGCAPTSMVGGSKESKAPGCRQKRKLGSSRQDAPGRAPSIIRLEFRDHTQPSHLGKLAR